MKNGKSMWRRRRPGVGWFVVGGAALAAVLLLIRSTPDLMRYLRVRRM